VAEVGCPRQRRSGQRRAAEAETERFESIASSMGCALTHVKKYARCAQSAVIPVNGEAERHDGWLPPSVSGGRRQPEAVCGGQAAHGATRLHSARQRDVVRVLSHDWQACRHLLERCVKNQPSLVEKGVVCPCTGVWGVVLSCRVRDGAWGVPKSQVATVSGHLQMEGTNQLNMHRGAGLSCYGG
jgi:hypothetical protein